MVVRITEMLPIGHICVLKRLRQAESLGENSPLQADRINWSRVTGAGQMGAVVADTQGQMEREARKGGQVIRSCHIFSEEKILFSFFQFFSSPLLLLFSSLRLVAAQRSVQCVSLPLCHMCPVHCDLSKCELDNQV